MDLLDLGKLSLCKESTGAEDDWIYLYESAFPPEERVAVERIRQDLVIGKRKLHCTLGPNDELLAFSIISPFPDFIWLSYIASQASKRSQGVGTKHLTRLIELLKDEFKNSKLGLFFDIEATWQEGLDEATLAVRQRRLKFYKRLGACSLSADKKYFMANFLPGQPPIPAELLWFEFGDKVTSDNLKAVVRSVYETVYRFSPDDPLITQITSGL